MNCVEETRKNAVIAEMVNVEYFPVLRDETILKENIKIPITELAAMGLPLAGVMQQVAEKTALAGALEGMSPLYALNMRGYSGSLAAMHDGSGFLTSVIGEGGQGVIGQAAFVPVNTGEIVSAGSVTINPVLMMATVMMLSINQKLDKIQVGQQEIMNYLKNKDKAELRAGMNMLIEIQNNYKYNLDNKEYKVAKIKMTQDIRKNAEEHGIANKKILKSILASGKMIHGNKEVNDRMGAIKEALQEYQIAVYVYAFAAFQETLLLENFKPEYLKSIIADIEEHSLQYREQYIECYDFMEEYMQTSVQSGAAKGLSVFTKKAGDAIAKVPILSKGPVDEALIDAGRKLQEMGEKSRERELKNLSKKQSSYIRPFVENIELMNRLYNEPKVMLFDSVNLYLVS
ncbi:MAG: hypothetical protein IKU46_08795 [Peptococcaceae bacterium]|nr:hypothetical protein [Peptococcaceae bacterium]